MSVSINPNRPRHSPPLIFVVDDHRELTELAEIVLTEEGYACKTFCDPKEVLQTLRDGGDLPDLLLTDYDMGSMNGLELIQHCREADPDLKTILVSGTIEVGAAMRHHVQVDEFLAKPYQPDQLVALVSSLLDGQPRSKRAGRE